MKIVINNQVELSEFRSLDKPALVQHLNDRDIYDRTLRIPFPYTEAAADDWLALVAKITAQEGRQVHWSIRTAGDALSGACGFARRAGRCPRKGKPARQNPPPTRRIGGGLPLPLGYLAVHRVKRVSAPADLWPTLGCGTRLA
jgi:hypothetical protein